MPRPNGSDSGCCEAVRTGLCQAHPYRHQSEFWLQLSWSCVHSFMPCISLLMVFFVCLTCDRCKDCCSEARQHQAKRRQENHRSCRGASDRRSCGCVSAQLLCAGFGLGMSVGAMHMSTRRNFVRSIYLSKHTRYA